MRWLIASLLVATAAYADAPIPADTVTIPRETLLQLMKDYKEQKAANILLWEQMEEIEKKYERWQAGTNCS